MNKYEFINEMIRQLEDLPAAEVEKAVEYYSEYFNEAMNHNQSEEAIIAKLGSPEAVALRIRAAYKPAGTRYRRRTGAIVACAVVLLVFCAIVSAMVFSYMNITAREGIITEFVEDHPDMVAATVTAPPDIQPQASDGGTWYSVATSGVTETITSSVNFSADNSEAYRDIGFDDELTDISGATSFSRAAVIPNDVAGLVPKPQGKTLVIGNDVSIIKISALGDNLRVERGGDKLTLCYYDRYGGDYTITKKGSTLSFELSPNYSKAANASNRAGYGSNMSGAEFLLTVPESMDLSEISIFCVSMNLTVGEGIRMDGLTVESTNLTLDAANADLGDISMETVNQTLVLANTKFDSLNSDSVNTSFTADGISLADYSVTAEGVNRSLVINGARYSGKEINTALASYNGQMKIELNAVNLDIELSE